MRNCLTILFLFICSCSIGQVSDISSTPSFNSLNSFVDQTSARIKKLDEQTNNATEKMLARLQQQEYKLSKKVRANDSLLHDQVFSNAAQFYQRLKVKLETVTDTNQVADLNEYIPYLDTLKTSFGFLSKQDDYFNNPELMEARQILQKYQNTLQITNTIKLEIQQREQQLKEQLQNLGFLKEFKSINKEVYYYQQQLSEYKAALKDPKKFEQKAIQLISQMSIFKEFMRKNSILASLFRIPDSNDPSAFADITGAQTRNSVQELLSRRFSGLSGSGNMVSPGQYMQQQVQAAQPQLNAIKDKLNKLKGGNSDMEMPDFKPDNQKTKSFLKRLEYGFNIQSLRGTGYLPVTTDFALFLGYKFNDKSVAGIGLAYKMGWGSDINNISISSQGVGIRSYLDAKIKGGIWASGGFEMNYMQEFSKWSDIHSVDVWQKSGLAGITKKYKAGKKDGKLQVLWDFLSYNQVPRGQPLKFRVGFNLNN